jgi:N,N-dimethylformamidase
VVTEEVNVMTPDLTGSQHDLVRADLAFYETPAGGAVFSTGSIAWCGSLSHNGYANNVARITGNVLRRFMDPAPFET